MDEKLRLQNALRSTLELRYATSNRGEGVQMIWVAKDGQAQYSSVDVIETKDRTNMTELFEGINLVLKDFQNTVENIQNPATHIILGRD
jgi:hypothetical protein